MLTKFKDNLKDSHIKNKLPTTSLEYAYNIIIRNLMSQGMNEVNASILLSDMVILMDNLKDKGYTKTSSTRMKFINFLKNNRFIK